MSEELPPETADDGTKPEPGPEPEQRTPDWFPAMASEPVSRDAAELVDESGEAHHPLGNGRRPSLRVLTSDDRWQRAKQRLREREQGQSRVVRDALATEAIETLGLIIRGVVAVVLFIIVLRACRRYQDGE